VSLHCLEKYLETFCASLSCTARKTIVHFRRASVSELVAIQSYVIARAVRRFSSSRLLIATKRAALQRRRRPKHIRLLLLVLLLHWARRASWPHCYFAPTATKLDKDDSSGRRGAPVERCGSHGGNDDE